MGTSWQLAIAGGPADPRAIVLPVMAQLVAESSLWEPASEICRFNAAEAGSLVPLSPGFAAVVRAALNIASQSNGAFDPALGVHSHLWGFGPAGEQPLPSILPPSGRWKELRWQGDSLLQPGAVALDLNGIAKGQAVDRVADALLAAGCRHFLFGIGGEYRAEGLRPDLQPWWVEVEQPPNAALPPLRVALAGMAIATSGDYRRAFLHEGHQLSHSLDPATGRPVSHGVASVTVIGPTCMTADAEATAILVMGAEQGMAWASHHGLAAQILVRDGYRFREDLSPALLAMLDS